MEPRASSPQKKSISVTRFLDPRQRALKAEQIGISSHKNEYKNNSLMNNWFEDREFISYEKQPIGLAAESSMRASFKNPSEVSTGKELRSGPAVSDSVPRDLLFGHGDQHSLSASSYVSLNELTITGQMKVPTSEAIQSRSPQRQRPDSLLATKTQQWQAEKNSDPYQSTYKAQHAPLPAASAAVARPVTNRGDFTRSLEVEERHMGLRTGVMLSKSPLVNGPTLS